MKKVKEIAVLFSICCMVMAIVMWGFWWHALVGGLLLTALIYTVIQFIYPDNELDDKINI